MGSLIPSEMWDWKSDWPKAIAAAVITLLVVGTLVLPTLIW